MERKASCWSLLFLSSDYVMMVRAAVFFDLVGLAPGGWTERPLFERINMYMNCRNREPAHKHMIQNPLFLLEELDPKPH